MIFGRMKMPKYMVYATEEVLYMKEIEAKNESEAKRVFMDELENSDIVDGRGAEITEIERIKNA
jgi:hypothetical protein